MHRHAHALGHQLSAEHADLGKERCELVAADACHHVPAADEQSEGVTDNSEQRVTGRMTLGIVDVLEAIYVHRKYGEREVAGWCARRGRIHAGS